MIVQWCLKGIPATSSFGDNDAIDILVSSGLTSNWTRANRSRRLGTAWRAAHRKLSGAALASHVNAYSTVSAATPYISLSAGVVERDPQSRTAIRHSAWSTALEFATQGGACEGYVFECWIHLPPNPAPELPGFGEEVRDLNLHRQYAWWHHEGEVAAKLVVPPRQILRVIKFMPDLSEARIHHPRASGGFVINRRFVSPERVSNIRNLI